MDDHRQLDLSRDAAAKHCSDLADDASLVTIDTEEEQEFLVTEIKRRVTEAGLEFAHEQWWTAGKARGERWVWDVLGYPQGNPASHCCSLSPIVTRHSSTLLHFPHIYHSTVDYCYPQHYSQKYNKTLWRKRTLLDSKFGENIRYSRLWVFSNGRCRVCAKCSANVANR